MRYRPMAVSAGGTSPVCLGQPGCAGAGPVQAVTVTAITDLLRLNGVVTQSPSRRTDDTTVPVRSPVNAAVKGPTTASVNRPVIVCSPVVVGIFSTNVPVKLPRVQLLTPCRVLPKRPGLVTGCPLTVPVQVAVPVSPWVVTAWWRACVVRPGWMSVVSVMVQARLALGAVLSVAAGAAAAGAAGAASSKAAPAEQESAYQIRRPGMWITVPPAGSAARTRHLSADRRRRGTAGDER